MKFWLIVMFFTQNGEFIDKMETPYETHGSCVVASGTVALSFNNTGTKIQTWCVSNDHYTGVKQDEGIPYDFHGEEE